MKPNLIIIGTQKCGTSSLHHYLNFHPDISMSKTKELDFFVDNLNWNKGIAWYESQFSGEAIVYGESSPSYTMYPNFSGVPKRMHSIIPDAKLIYIVRDPIDRIISHYLHQWYTKRQDASLEEMLLNPSDTKMQHYINTSKYHLQLSQYTDYYDLSNILVLSLEEMKHNRGETLRLVFNHLQIDDTFSITHDLKPLNKTESKIRKNFFGNVIFSNSIIATTARQVAKHILPNSLNKQIKARLGSKQIKPQLTHEVHTKLKDILQEDINNFRVMTGKNFNEWKI